MISLVIPVYNEEENIKILHEKISTALRGNNIDYEVIYVDDGSNDNSYNLLKEIKDENTKIIKFRRNFGQTASMQAGINNSKGDIIITLDADLQNDPNDIPKLIEKYKEGYDLVSGWRKNRHDNITRTFPSKIANFLISNITKTGLHDTGCTLKAYNGDILRRINLFGDHHRFIPAIFMEYSDKITEVEVEHHPRIYGKSKYNIFRIFRIINDLAAIAYWKNYKNKPMYFWGNLSAIMFILAIISIVIWFLYLISNIITVFNIILPLLAIILIMSGTITFAIGLIFEAILRNDLRQDKEQNYQIESII